MDDMKTKTKTKTKTETFELDSMGLPIIKAYKLEIPIDMFKKNFHSLNKAIEHSNSWMFDMVEENYPPIIRFHNSTIYIPKFEVILQNFLASLIAHANVECGLMFEIIRQLAEDVPEEFTHQEWLDEIYENLNMGNEIYRDSFANK